MTKENPNKSVFFWPKQREIKIFKNQFLQSRKAKKKDKEKIEKEDFIF